jgi:hypothetical protein
METIIWKFAEMEVKKDYSLFRDWLTIGTLFSSARSQYCLSFDLNTHYLGLADCNRFLPKVIKWNPKDKASLKLLCITIYFHRLHIALRISKHSRIIYRENIKRYRVDL